MHAHENVATIKTSTTGTEASAHAQVSAASART